jgi:lysophospholipase L1-like esterase
VAVIVHKWQCQYQYTVALSKRVSRLCLRSPMVLTRLSSYAGLFLLTFFCAACSFWPGGQTANSSPLILQQPPKARLTYVAIGASDTFGIGSDDPDEENWAADLARTLGSGVHLVNLGVPSIVTRQALDVELPVAIDAHPDLVTIWLAVNDLVANVAPASYAHDLDTMLTRLQAAAPHARIALANVPDLTLLPHFQSSDMQALRAQISAYNSALATIVNQHHVLLVDLYQQWHLLAGHPEYVSSDGFHPSDKGYRQIAQIFYRTLQGRTS